MSESRRALRQPGQAPPSRGPGCEPVSSLQSAQCGHHRRAPGGNRARWWDIRRNFL